MKRIVETWESDPDGKSRISVELTNKQKAEIHQAMELQGIRSISDFLRFSALQRARQ